MCSLFFCSIPTSFNVLLYKYLQLVWEYAFKLVIETYFCTLHCVINNYVCCMQYIKHVHLFPVLNNWIIFFWMHMLVFISVCNDTSEMRVITCWELFNSMAFSVWHKEYFFMGVFSSIFSRMHFMRTECVVSWFHSNLFMSAPFGQAHPTSACECFIHTSV